MDKGKGGLVHVDFKKTLVQRAFDLDMQEKYVLIFSGKY